MNCPKCKRRMSPTVIEGVGVPITPDSHQEMINMFMVCPEECFTTSNRVAWTCSKGHVKVVEAKMV